MADVFDELEAPTTDIFDEVSGDIFDQVSIAELGADNLPTDMGARQRKRLELGSEMASEQAAQSERDRKSSLIAPVQNIAEGALTALSLSPSAIASQFERGIPAIPAAIRGDESFTPLPPVVSGALNPGEERAIKIPSIPTTKDTPVVGQVAAGLGNAVIDFANIFTTPEGIATLGIGALPKAAQKQVIGTMAANMAAHYPQEFEEAIAAAKAGDFSTATKKIVSTPVMASVMGRASVDMPRVPRAPEFPGLPDADLIARNNAAPGTVRPQEQQRFGASEIPAPEMFEAGSVPFERMQRMGGVPLPPVEILPRMGRIEDIPILEETRPKEQLETRGKVSFGAGAPVLLRNAIEQAESVGLPKAAEAARKATEPKASEPVKAVEPVEAAPTTAAESRANAATKTPEQIAAELAAVQAEIAAMPKPGADATPAERMAYLTKKTELANRAGFLKEGADVQREQATAPAKTAKPQTTKQEFDKLALDYAILHELPYNEIVQQDVSLLHPGAKSTHNREVQRIRREVLKQIGVSGDAADNAVLKSAIQKLKADIAKRESTLVEDAVDAETRRIIDSIDQSGSTDFLPPEIPKLASGEKGTGEMFKGADQPFNLAGEKGVDFERIAAEKTKAEQAKKEAADLVAKQQPDLPGTKPRLISNTAAEKWADSVLRGGSTHAGPDVFAAYAIKGAAIIERGVTDFAKWSEEMIRRHGPEVKANLRAIYDQSVGLIENEKKRVAQPATSNPAVTPESAPTISARPASPDLADIYKIFEPDPVKKPSLKQRAGEAYEAVRTGLSSKFRPLNKLAEDIAKQYGGKPTDVAAIFEQVKGASGKSEADIYRFNESMKPVSGAEKDFNAYLFLRRGLDRLNQDLADINKAQAGGDVPKLNRRSVGDYTIRDLKSKLRTLEQQVGPETLAKFEQAADAYQVHLDEALKLQVSSGRMSPEVYQAIKNGNQFYAPFKMLKYIEQTTRPPGTGNAIQTLADYTKAMEGIESKEFKLGDMLAAARQNIALSRVLAEKNKAMREVAALATIDTDGVFIRKLKPGEDAPKGMTDIALLDNGKTERFAVNDAVAQAVKFDEKIGGIIPRMAANVFRFGATVGNIPFQFSNLLADVPRQALVSKFGVQILPDLLLYPFDKYAGKQTNIPKSAVQSLKYPLDLLEAIYSSMVGDVVGPKNKLMLDFLDSGAAGSSIQEYLTPNALRGTSKPEGVAKKVALSPVRAAMAVEQVSKLTGVKRAMDSRVLESAKDLTPEEVTEIRRFSGSPDFGRIGKWTEKYGLNIAEMFLNARIQGAVADVGRLKGRDGPRAAAATWINLSAAVGVPTLLLYLKNHETDADSQSIDARSDQERKNYWLLPKMNEDGTPQMIQTPQGPIRDYWRIPKRESSKWMANFVEAGLDFSRQKDPETFNKWAVGMLEELSPVNVTGDTLQERGESVLAGLNPLIKVPIEATMGRDTYRHREIIPDSMKKASPEQQYTERTPALFKELAVAMPDVAPELLRSPLMLENMTKNLTAGLITQFLPRKPVEGRSGIENTPLLQRFQALPFLDDSDFDERMKAYERESNDEQLARFRRAREIADQFKGKPSLNGAAPLVKGDPKLAEGVVDLWVADKVGITAKERRIIALPSSERAKYVMDELKGKSPDEKSAIINDLRKKRILTESVAVEMNKLTPKP